MTIQKLLVVITTTLMFAFSANTSTAGCFGFCEDSTKERLEYLSDKALHIIATEEGWDNLIDIKKSNESFFSFSLPQDKSSTLSLILYNVAFESSNGSKGKGMVYVEGLEEGYIDLEKKIKKKPMRIRVFDVPIGLATNAEEVARIKENRAYYEKKIKKLRNDQSSIAKKGMKILEIDNNEVATYSESLMALHGIN